MILSSILERAKQVLGTRVVDALFPLPTAPESKRYSVSVEREVIIYALNPDEAGAKALSYLIGLGEQPATRPIRVTLITELPPVETEGHGPEIDVAPARETR